MTQLIQLEMLKLSFLSLLFLVAVTTISSSRVCPLWTKEQNSSCKCGSSAYGLVKCADNEGISAVSKCYCLTADKNNVTPLVGACIFTCQLILNTSHHKVQASSIDMLDNEMCGPLKRTGVMCGKCMKDYGLPVYSYSLSCVKCTDYKHNWIKYIAKAYVPLTAFYALVVILGLSANSGLIAGYITICQMLSLQGLVLFLVKLTDYGYVLKYGIAGYSIWNLDFFRSLYAPSCLHPNLSSLHVFMLDYAIALYPQILILLTYLAVKLHDRFKAVMWLFKPLTLCFSYFRKGWSIKNSLIEAFATFYVLSYVKILNTSSDILKQNYLIDPDGKQSIRFYYNASLAYFGEGHYPFAITAIAFLIIFNFLPLLLLCLYPCHCFHTFLNKTGYRWQALHAFMDAILGSYTHKPRERRYFGAIYISLRFLHLLVFALLNLTTYFTATSYIMIVVTILVAMFRPHKNNWYNITDVFLFSATLHCYLMAAFCQEASLSDPYTSKIQVPVSRISIYVVAGIIPLYGAVALVIIALPQQFVQKLAELARQRTRNIPLIESLPYRIEDNPRTPRL